MLWDEIKKLPQCEPVPMPAPHSEIQFFRVPFKDGEHWLVGRYLELRKVAKYLRSQGELRDILSGNHVRLGLRDTDTPPKDVEAKERFGATVKGEHGQTDFTFKRIDSLARPARPERPIPVNRRGDREQNVKDFWDTQTPQAHHIVEFNNLEGLTESKKTGKGDMDYGQLPAVLLAAEFHQRYISSILKPAQKWDQKRLRAEISVLYQGIYVGRSKLLEPLWAISKMILQQAGIKTP